MPKRTRKQMSAGNRLNSIPEPVVEVPREPEVSEVAVLDNVPDIVVEEELRKYTFKSSPGCPHCGSTTTHATSTQGKLQYRKCQGCQRSFSQYAIKFTDL